MDSEANELQPKQERLRTRWTPSHDKIFADIVVEQIQLGNRPNNVFDKKTWNNIRDEFNRRTQLSFNNNQLRKHLDVLRTRYNNLKSVCAQTDTVEDPCYVGFDLWEDIGAHLKPQTTKTKECPIYEQLCTIFADSGTDGKYAQSSHYKELETSSMNLSCPGNGNPSVKTLPSSNSLQGSTSSPPIMAKNVAERKRKRLSDVASNLGENSRDQEVSDAMAKAMLEMVASSRLHKVAAPGRDERFTITNCIKVLDEIEGIDDNLYYAALDLFEDPGMREIFLSLKSSKVRLVWLHGKCSNFAA